MLFRFIFIKRSEELSERLPRSSRQADKAEYKKENIFSDQPDVSPIERRPHSWLTFEALGRVLSFIIIIIS